MNAQLPNAIEAYLRGFVRQRRWFALVRAAGAAAGFVLAWSLLACLLDRALRLPGAARLALLVAALAGAALILGSPLARMLRRRIDWVGAAAGVEQARNAFGERLLTVVSQFSQPPAYRGSPSMLQSLLEAVQDLIARDRDRRWVKWSSAAWGWAAAGVVLALGGLLATVPAMDMPRLMARFARPLEPIAPVTRTRITLAPGDVSIPRGGPLVIRATVQNAGTSAVEVCTSTDAQAWSRIAMLPAGPGQYVFALPALERDVSYYVEAGDAVTPVHLAKVLRPPVVAEYRLRYEYPTYTGLSALTVTRADGLIEAVLGTRVAVTVVSTEPLRQGAIVLEGRRIPMHQAGQANLWQGELLVQASGEADVELTSAGGLDARVSKALRLRALADREPIVRLVQPAEDLRLHPRALLRMQYQAMDDYGIAELTIEAKVNSNAPVSLPTQRRGDSRRLEGPCVLDLAALNVKVGDVVTVQLAAADGMGHRSVSEGRRILISPRSIDLGTHARIAELKQAAKLAASGSQQLESAAESLEASRRTDAVQADYIIARMRAGTSLAGAVEASLLLHQALLRACGSSGSAQQTLALARCVDEARIVATACERLAAAEAAEASELVMLDHLQAANERARTLADHVRTMSEAEQAAAILVERANLRPPADAPAADKATAELLKETLRRARQEMDWAVEEMGLRAGSPDLEQVLERKVAAGAQFVRSCRAIDWEAQAMQWAASLADPARRADDPGDLRGDDALVALSERLASASSVESLRPDRDPIAARDWQLASKVVASSVQAARAELDGPARAMREQLPRLLGTLQREHEMARGAGSRQSPELEGLRQAADAARGQLAEWAMRMGARGADDLALEASAATAKRDYESARRADQQLAGSQDMQAVDRAMAQVEQIDEVTGQQRAISDQTAALAAENEARAAELSAAQQAVAQRIDRLDQADPLKVGLAANAETRRGAMAAIQKTQEQLAHMPQQLTAAQKSAEAYRAAAMLVIDAQRAVEASTGDEQAAALRAVELARRGVQDAARELDLATRGLSAEALEQLAAALAQFEPDTAEATDALRRRLGPALDAARLAMREGDKPAVERAAMRVRSAIESAQLALRDVQGRMIESDPLVVARWFAESAAQSLAAVPADVDKARGQQQAVSTALDKAWQGAVREAARQRLPLVSGYRALVGPGAELKGIDGMLPGARQWGYLRGDAGQSYGATDRGGDVGGYSEPVNVYFEFLEKVHGGQ